MTTSITRRRQRILCVDDNPDSCEVIRILLPNYDIFTAATISRALELARLERFDLYILDATYQGGGSGVELCHRIRAFDVSTPILFFSSRSENTDIRHSLGAGAQAYLIKPDDFEILGDKVDELLKGPA